MRGLTCSGNASISQVTHDERFQRALAVGGRLFVIVGEGPAMSARLVRRTSPTTWMSQDLFETWIEPLLHATRSPRFVF